MEFWIGLSVGMHLGRVIADYLEKLVDAHDLLPPDTLRTIKRIESREDTLSSAVDDFVK